MAPTPRPLRHAEDTAIDHMIQYVRNERARMANVQLREAVQAPWGCTPGMMGLAGLISGRALCCNALPAALQPPPRRGAQLTCDAGAASALACNSSRFFCRSTSRAACASGTVPALTFSASSGLAALTLWACCNFRRGTWWALAVDSRESLVRSREG